MSELFQRLSAPFAPEIVSWRVGSTTQDKKKGMALAYIDARDVMARLDEVVGPANWQRRHPWSEGKRLCCEIGIRVDGEWVWKSDGAGDTDVEAEKGSFSDAFKRAAVSWGIGRYLYNLESPWVELEPMGRSYKIADKEKARLRAILTKHGAQPNSSPAVATPSARAPSHVPIPLNAEGSDSDWERWGKALMPQRFQACRTADEVQAVIHANQDGLDNLKAKKPKLYNWLESRWNGLAAELLGKVA